MLVGAAQVGAAQKPTRINRDEVISVNSYTIYSDALSAVTGAGVLHCVSPARERVGLEKVIERQKGEGRPSVTVVTMDHGGYKSHQRKTQAAARAAAAAKIRKEGRLRLYEPVEVSSRVEVYSLVAISYSGVLLRHLLIGGLVRALASVF